MVHPDGRIEHDCVPGPDDPPVDVHVLAPEEAGVVFARSGERLGPVGDIDAGKGAHGADIRVGGEGCQVGDLSDDGALACADDRASHRARLRVLLKRPDDLSDPVGEDLGVVVGHGDDAARAVLEADVAGDREVDVLRLDQLEVEAG